ncbi:glycerol-3-phosphate dehydrogenase subunit C [Oceanospirillum sediminis]|uniref:Glycerol-3-phosphate dehydrogenase subunit C n=1 Tax=Oceanospirillum sediminis TaxID=2760088 RepID=A0A839IR14_9GAMM|nr:glycerol-3-phosphate dehydrogenase subunit C [Oceanospirillum sediminis]MBB1487715.1 glycerol-3-phosphate dehydrogenase subunit C [Oceanospirillum sediminis]
MSAAKKPTPRRVKAKRSTEKKAPAKPSPAESDCPAQSQDAIFQESCDHSIAALAQNNVNLSTSQALSNQAHAAEAGQMQSDIQLQTTTIQGLNALFSQSPLNQQK